MISYPNPLLFVISVLSISIGIVILIFPILKLFVGILKYFPIETIGLLSILLGLVCILIMKCDEESNETE